jgi:hypothetical protein
MSVDTLSIARELKATKMPAAQAEAIAAAIGYSLHENVATKSDLRELELRFDSKIDAKIENLKSTMMLWFIGTNLTMAAIILAALKL